jgi:tRNA G18 (ribose-2'-O)-methylase SpoU
MTRALRVTTRNASFQQWQALLTNRTKRQRAGEFLVQGVRPITLAVEHGWTVHTLIYPDRQSPPSGSRSSPAQPPPSQPPPSQPPSAQPSSAQPSALSSSALSSWAREMLDRTGATPVAMDPGLLAELAGKESPELLAVVAMPPDRADRIPISPHLLVVVFDRPATPGNIGTLVRSADAFGAAAVIVTGHAADPYDPKSVRASTGSMFAVPVIRTDSHREVLDWVGDLRAGGLDLEIVGTDEHGALDVAEYDLTGPRVLLIGNETHGLSSGWREACDTMVRIPITGAASSLNAASAATVVLYEARRQRMRPS